MRFIGGEFFYSTSAINQIDTKTNKGTTYEEIRKKHFNHKRCGWKNIVIINDIRFKGKRSVNWNDVIDIKKETGNPLGS